MKAGAIHWVEADVPVPVEQTIKGRVDG